MTTTGVTIPVWAAGAFVAFALAQFGLFVAWAIRADRRLALIEMSLARATAIMERHDLAVIAQRLEVLEHDSAEHKSAHARNRERIEELRKEMHGLFLGRQSGHGG